LPEAFKHFSQSRVDSLLMSYAGHLIPQLDAEQSLDPLFRPPLPTGLAPTSQLDPLLLLAARTITESPQVSKRQRAQELQLGDVHP
jgi:hypothetical protein